MTTDISLSRKSNYLSIWRGRHPLKSGSNTGPIQREYIMTINTFSSSKKSASKLESSLNKNLKNLIVESILGTGIDYGNSKNRGSLMISTGSGRKCQVKIWAVKGASDLEKDIQKFLNGADFDGEIADLSVAYGNGKWRVMLTYYTTISSATSSSVFRVTASDSGNTSGFDKTMNNNVKIGYTPVVYAYTYGNNKHRGILIQSDLD